jgi:hypothetical protein
MLAITKWRFAIAVGRTKDDPQPDMCVVIYVAKEYSKLIANGKGYE